MSSFRAVAPETRADRAARQDKTSLEKSRLSERREKFVRYEDIGNPTEPVKNTLSYLDDTERFHTDTAGDIRADREKIIQKREEMFAQKRNACLTREEERWSKMENERKMQQEKLQMMQNSTKGTMNHSSVAYDAITLEYHATPAGSQQKFEDDMAKFRAGVRTEKLHRYGSGDGYNPITGQELRPLRLPGRPNV